MAVNTTVEVVMPAMGESVSEGTVLEWHKQEGDTVAEDETLVEISTDKVDAEVPAPAAGTVVKIHVAEGDTVDVGAVLAEIAPQRRRAAGAAAEAPAEAEAEAAEPADGESIDIVDARDGRVGHRGHDPRVGQAGRRRVEADETIVEISTDKVDAEVPAPAGGTITEILAEAGETVTVGQVIARMTAGAGARAPKAAAPAPEPEPARRARARRRTPPCPTASRSRRSPRVAAAEGVDLAGVQGTGPGGRITKADVLGGANGNGAPAPPRKPPRRPAAQGRRGDARPLHGRVAVDPDRDLVPHDHRHDARRPPQAAQGGRPEGLLHAPDRLRDRARGDRGDAGDGAPLRRDRRQAAP